LAELCFTVGAVFALGVGYADGKIVGVAPSA
jgi:hypothetical protein